MQEKVVFLMSRYNVLLLYLPLFKQLSLIRNENKLNTGLVISFSYKSKTRWNSYISNF